MLPRGCESTDSDTTTGSPPLRQAKTTLSGHYLAEGKLSGRSKGPATTTTTTMIVRGRKSKRRQEDKETTTTGVATTTVCRRVCDNDHNYKEEEDRLTTMTGDMKAQGEGCHNDTTTKMTAMTTMTTGEVQRQKRDNDIVGLPHQTDWQIETTTTSFLFTVLNGFGGQRFGTRPFHSPSHFGMHLYLVHPHFPSPNKRERPLKLWGWCVVGGRLWFVSKIITRRNLLFWK